MSTDYVGHWAHQSRITDIFPKAMKAASDLRPYAKEFDTIAVRGISGLLIGPMLAEMLGKNLVVIRKTQAELTCAHASMVEGYLGDHYIILDDHIATGNTIRTIQDELRAVKPEAAYMGYYMYDDPMTGQEMHIGYVPNFA